LNALKAWMKKRPWIAEVWEEQLGKMKLHKEDTAIPLEYDEFEFKSLMAKKAKSMHDEKGRGDPK
jgi:hypothetical protein